MCVCVCVCDQIPDEIYLTERSLDYLPRWSHSKPIFLRWRENNWIHTFP